MVERRQAQASEIQDARGKVLTVCEVYFGSPSARDISMPGALTKYSLADIGGARALVVSEMTVGDKESQILMACAVPIRIDLNGWLVTGDVFHDHTRPYGLMQELDDEWLLALKANQ